MKLTLDFIRMWKYQSVMSYLSKILPCHDEVDFYDLLVQHKLCLLIVFNNVKVKIAIM